MTDSIDFDRLRKIIDEWNEKSVSEYEKIANIENPDTVPDRNFYDCTEE